MSWHYEYTPYLWPTLATGAFVAFLAVYGWRRRSVPGALPFATMMVTGVPFALGAALDLACQDLAGKIFWSQFQHLWILPSMSAAVWFALEYAGLGRWLNRWTVPLLAVPPLLSDWLILTNGAHRLVFRGFSFDRYLHLAFGPAGWVMVAYVLLLMATMSLVFIWLFVTSPQHRRPVAYCLCGQIAIRVAPLLSASDVNPVAPLDPAVLAVALTSAAYALALFHFRILDLISIARGTMVEQMREGMLVLDLQRRIVDLNPAAERILGVPAARVRGGNLAEVFPACRTTESEITFVTGGAARLYALYHSTLKNQRGLALGSLILFHDITEQKQAQAQLLEQQRAVATLRERDRVARELHDSLGQVLGYVKMQAQAARGMLAKKQIEEVDACLVQLAAVAQDAHGDVREYILGARAGMSAAGGFVSALEDYLRRLGENFGMATKLTVSSELAKRAYEPMVEAQLLRIIQEALTNIRKHAGACRVDIRLGGADGHAEAIVEDDGVGFDSALLEATAGLKFGLRFMRERAEEVGGSVQVHSARGQGTRVVIHVPLRKELS
jgi:PAS domain S-box-containing protein